MAQTDRQMDDLSVTSRATHLQMTSGRVRPRGSCHVSSAEERLAMRLSALSVLSRSLHQSGT